MTAFQLPLSGSHVDGVDGAGLGADGAVLSTPSLGITEKSRASRNEATDFQLPLSGSQLFDDESLCSEEAFNSLSRDHGTPTRGLTPALGHRPCRFQLPLSGSLVRDVVIREPREV